MTILMLETIDDDAMTVLQNAAPVLVSPSPDAHGHDLPFDKVTAIVTRGLGQLDRALIEKCPDLKVIARCGAGLNNLDVTAAAERNIRVIFAPGINATSVSEHTLMLMLLAVRYGFVSGVQVKQGNWGIRKDFPGDDLYSKKVCVIGGGNIGRRTADLCRAFGMNVIICGRNGKGIEGLKDALKQHLPDSDIVSLHIPLTSETRELVSGELLNSFKPGAVLVNTARGELVHTGDLIDSLNSVRLSAYAADVIAGGVPGPDNRIVAHPRTIVTPHVAAMTRRTYRAMGLFTAKNVVLALTDGNPDPASVYRGAA